MKRKELSILSKFSGNKAVNYAMYAKIKDGFLTVTNLNSSAAVPINHKGNGFVEFDLLKKVLAKNDIESIIFKDGFCELQCSKKVFKFEEGKDINFPCNHVGEIFENSVSLNVTSDLLSFKKFTLKDPLRPYFSGLYWSKNFVATNAQFMIWGNAPTIHKDVLLHEDFFNIPEGNYTVSFSKKNVKFEGEINFVLPLLNERFPNYEAVIPYENDKKITFSKKDMLELLENSLIVNNKISSIDSFGNIEAIDIDSGSEFKGKLSTFNSVGEIKISFNPNLMKIILATCGENITIDLSTPNRGMIIDSNKLLMPVLI